MKLILVVSQKKLARNTAIHLAVSAEAGNRSGRQGFSKHQSMVASNSTEELTLRSLISPLKGLLMTMFFRKHSFLDLTRQVGWELLFPFHLS